MMKREKDLNVWDVFEFDTGLCISLFAYLGHNGTDYNALNLSAYKPVKLQLTFVDVNVVGKLKVEYYK